MEQNKYTNHIEKILLGIIALLLLISVFLQLKETIPTKACTQAREEAISVMNQSTDFLDNYEEDVYGSKVENINQQIFRVNEYQLFTDERLLLYQQAISKVAVECQW